MSERAQGIEKTVLLVIESNVNLENPYMTRRQINAEMEKTAFVSLKKEQYPSDVKSGETHFERAIDQALKRLLEEEEIKKYRDRKGKYTIVGKRIMHRPVVCKALRKENDRPNYCPIKKMYIGDPRSQCELIYFTDTDRLVKDNIPMRDCYFKKKPSEKQIEYAIVKYEERKEEIKSQHDKLKALRGGS